MEHLAIEFMGTMAWSLYEDIETPKKQSLSIEKFTLRDFEVACDMLIADFEITDIDVGNIIALSR